MHSADSYVSPGPVAALSSTLTGGSCSPLTLKVCMRRSSKGFFAFLGRGPRALWFGNWFGNFIGV